MPPRLMPLLLALAALCAVVLLPAIGREPARQSLTSGIGQGAIGMAPAGALPDDGAAVTPADPDPSRRGHGHGRSVRRRDSHPARHGRDRNDRRHAPTRDTGRPGRNGVNDQPTAAASPAGPEEKPIHTRATSAPDTAPRDRAASRTPTRPAAGAATRTPTPRPKTATPTATATTKPTSTSTASVTPTPTRTPTPSATPTPSPTHTRTAIPSPSWTPTPTRSPTATPSPSPTATRTPTPRATPTITPTPSPTATATPPPTATASATPSPTATATLSPTATATQPPTATATPSPSPTATRTPTPSATPTITPTPSPTPTPLPPPTIYYCVDGTTTCQNPGWARTIQEAITGAIANAIRAVVPVIVVPPALYDERLTVGGNAAVRIVAGSSSTGMVAFGGRTWQVETLAAQAAAAPVVRPSGGGSVITIEAGSTLILDGFTLEGGTGTAITIIDPQTGQPVQSLTGAGILNYGTLELHSVTLAGNTPPANTGAAVFISSGASATIRDSNITGNHGVGIHNQGVLSLTNTRVDDNTDAGVYTITLPNSPAAGAEIIGGSVSGNRIGVSGWYVNAPTAIPNPLRLTLDGVTIRGNDLFGVSGADAVVSITGGEISGHGYAALLSGCSTAEGCTNASVTIDGTRIEDNGGNPQNGPWPGSGALRIDSGRLLLANSTLARNEAHMNNYQGSALNIGGECYQRTGYGCGTTSVTIRDTVIRDSLGGYAALISRNATLDFSGVTLQTTVPRAADAEKPLGMFIEGGTTSIADSTVAGAGQGIMVSDLCENAYPPAGGGVWKCDAPIEPTLTLTRVTLSGNDTGFHASPRWQGVPDITFQDSTVRDNGNGVVHSGSSLIRLNNTLITGHARPNWPFAVGLYLSSGNGDASWPTGQVIIGEGTRITANAWGIRRFSGTATVTGISPDTVYGNTVNCEGITGCS